MLSLNSVPRCAYVHVPFCEHRCGYCNFTLVQGRRDLVDRFLDALEIELSQLDTPRPMETVFIGGGTPTWLSPQPLRRLLEMVAHWLPMNRGGEWTCEANPQDCTDEKLRQLRDGGVNRLSLGGQSFNDEKLRRLQRDHSGIELRRAIGLAGNLFDNVSLDLIFAAPGESLDVWQSDVARALASGVQHLSTYGLTIEKGSAFFGSIRRGVLHEVDEDTQLEMYRHAIDAAASAGWNHYEVSSFSRPGFQCRHNQVYWAGKPWLAFGPGAARFVDGTRSVNHRSTTTYIRKILTHETAIAESEKLTDEQLVRERLVFGLRCISGISLSDLATSLFPNPEELFQPDLTRYIQQGWLSRCGDRIALTREGLMISDSLWPALLRGPSSGHWQAES